MAGIGLNGFEIINQNVTFLLDVLGYPKPLDAAAIADCDDGLSVEYAECVCWLCSEIRRLCEVEECIHTIAGPEDADSFYAELNGFLRELKCPYFESWAPQRSSQDPFNKLEVLNYLCTELLALRGISDPSRAKSQAMSPAGVLQAAAKELCIEESFDASASPKILERILEKVKERIEESPRGCLGGPLLTDAMNGEQWVYVEKLNEKLRSDYIARAAMMMKRLDVTIQSFSWSDRLKERKKEISTIYSALKEKLNDNWNIDVADVLAARSDLTYVERASSSNLCIGSEQRKLMLQGVGPPDRGGRPKDVQRMPQWKERVVEGGGGPRRDQQRHKKRKDKFKPWDADKSGSAPSGSASMRKRSQRKGKRAADATGDEIFESTQL